MLRDRIVCSLRDSGDVKHLLASAQVEHVERAAELFMATVLAGGKVLLFGNGGSAADAQHLATELVCRYVRDREPLPAIALTTDTSVLTAIANDYGYDEVFARQVRALGRPGDLAVAISTSGRSPNVSRGARAAADAGLATLALTGRDGGELAGLVDVAVVVPSWVTARIQEAHIAIGHVFCELLDDRVLGTEPDLVPALAPVPPKLLDEETLLDKRSRWRAAGTVLVWTTADADVLTVDQARALRAAKAHGDVLVVGVQGSSGASARAELLAGLACVDHVVIVDEEPLDMVLARLEPDLCLPIDAPALVGRW